MTWDDEAVAWDDNEAVRAYSRAAYANLERLQDTGRFELDGTRVLDFGCGTGLLTEQLARRARRVVALDTSAAMVRIVSAKLDRLGLSDVDVMKSSSDAAPVERPDLFAAPFDLVVCSSVCAFVDDYPATASRLVAFLRPEGWFVQWDWERNPDDAEPFGLTRLQVENTLTGAGLEDVHVDTAFEVEADGQTMKPLIGFGRAGSKSNE